MANMQRMGGIGAGVMQGLQFMRQRESDARQDQVLANQNQQLQMNQQIHGEKMGALNRENEERQRVGTIDKMRTNIHSVYGDLPDYVREQMAIDNGLKTGLFKYADLAAANEKVEGLRKVASPEAYDSLMRGDIKPAQTLLKSKGIDLQPDSDVQGSYRVLLPGSSTPQVFTRQGLLQLNAMSGAFEREKARSDAELKTRKTEAEIGSLVSRSNLNNRLPQERLGGAGGAGRGAGGKQPVDPAAMLPVDAYLERFGIGKDSDPATRARADDGYGYYIRLHKSNPGLFNSLDGNEMAFRLSRDLMNGRVQRDTKFDPKTMSWNRYVIDTQGGTYKIDPYNIDPRKLQGPDGKPALDPVVIEQEEIAALRGFSRENPSQYRAATSLAQAKELSDAELLAAADGKPISSGERSAMLSPAVANVALMIRRRGIEKPKLLAGGIKRKPLPDTSGYGAGGSKGTSLAGEAFDDYIADPVIKFFKDSADKARAE